MIGVVDTVVSLLWNWFSRDFHTLKFSDLSKSFKSCCLRNWVINSCFYTNEHRYSGPEMLASISFISICLVLVYAWPWAVHPLGAFRFSSLPPCIHPRISNWHRHALRPHLPALDSFFPTTLSCDFPHLFKLAIVARPRYTLWVPSAERNQQGAARMRSQYLSSFCGSQMLNPSVDIRNSMFEE